MPSQITGALIKATTSTVESMCFTAVLNEALPDPATFAFAADVPFSGDANGLVRVELTADAAACVASGFLGTDQEETDEATARTVLLELANMICGCMLSLHNPSGSFAIGSPETTAPSHSIDADAVCAFELETGVIRVSFAGKAVCEDEARP